MDWPKRNWLDDDIEASVMEVIRYYRELEQDLPSQSHFENIYCQNFSSYQGAGFTDAVNSGTSALYIALNAIGAKSDDLVISSPVTDFGSISAMALMGLKIVIADAKSERNSFNTHFDKNEKKYTPDIKGIILTHSAGDPIDDIQKISSFCKEKGIWLIEDCSQAHGATIENRKVGNFSDIAIFSTMHSKNHASGGTGGLVFTQQEYLYHRIRSFSDRGKKFHLTNFNSKDPDHIEFPALNLGSNEISCAIGNSNLNRLNRTITKRLQYLKNLKIALNHEDLPFEVCLNLEHASPYFCPILIKDQNIDRARFKRSIVDLGLPCNPEYSFVVTQWEWAKQYLVNHQSPQALEFRNHSFNLLFNENYGDAQVEQTIYILKKALNNES